MKSEADAAYVEETLDALRPKLIALLAMGADDVRVNVTASMSMPVDMIEVKIVTPYGNHVPYVDGKYLPRPDTDEPVEFIGPVEPTEMRVDDRWVNNSDG